MIHYGDITKISGYDVPIVDCVIGGSPCQDLSVAGKRAGLDGERSGLFMEQLRLIKELRDKDARSGRTGEFIRPRFMVWENVPGAFNSNKGQDFRIVLEETAKIVDKDATIPMPPKDKWSTSGCIMGDGWSIAWRVLDAQFWGVPQRRRRIALVADFGGGCAQEILFERKGLRGDSAESRTKGQSPSADAQGCLGVYDSTRRSYGFDQGATRDVGALFLEEQSKTLANGSCPGHHNGVVICYDIGDRRRIPNEFEDVSPTLLSKMGTGGNNVPVIMQTFRKQSRAKTSDDATTWVEASVSNTLNTFDIGETRCNEIVVAKVEGLDVYNQQLTGEKTMTLTCQATDSHHVPCVVMDRASYNQGENAKFNIGIDEDGVAFSHIAKGPGAVCYIDTSHADDVVRTDDVVAPLQARDYKGGKYVFCLQGNQIDQADTSVCNGSGWKEDSSYTLNVRDRHAVCYKKPHYIVRRLTPLECERLQGFKDGWTDIGEYIDSKGKKKQSSDSARYKALGNSIALPPWKWVIKRLCSHYERDATMASLFDGIGGFPCIWEQINGKGTAVWASEIEDFPIAVTKVRIE